MGRGIIAEGYNFRPDDLDASITATSPLQTTRCPGRSPDEDPEYRSPEPPADLTRRFWGCSAGTATVSLVAGSTTLATATVRVTAPPRPTPVPTPIPPPPPPLPDVTGLTASATGTTVSLEWNELTSSTRFEISRKKNDGADSYAVLASVVGASFEDSSPLCGTEYVYRVRVVRGSRKGRASTITLPTDECPECAKHNLISPVDALNILDYTEGTTRPWEKVRRASGAYPRDLCTAPSQNSPTYAVLYKFEIPQASHLRIHLEGTLGADPVVTLVQGTNMIETNDTSSEHGAPDAQIAQEFPKAVYTVEVSLVTTLEEPPPMGARYILKVYAQEPMPDWGHQRDHTVSYEIGEMPTEAPEEEDDEGFGNYFHDSLTLPAGIIEAAKQWHSQVGESWPNVRFCRSDVEETDAHRCPDGVNDDRVTATAMIVTEGTCDTGHLDGVACVDFEDHVSNGHVLVPDVFFEHPTHVMRMDPDSADGEMRDFRVKWISKPDEDRQFINVNGVRMYAVYAKGIALHEFGHLAGLTDLYGLDAGYSGFLMYDPHETSVVPDLDVRYLKQVYRNEHGAAPHRGDLSPLGGGE